MCAHKYVNPKSAHKYGNPKRSRMNDCKFPVALSIVN